LIVVVGVVVIGGVVALVMMNSGGKSAGAQSSASATSTCQAPGTRSASSGKPNSSPSSSSTPTSPAKVSSGAPPGGSATGPAPVGKADPKDLAEHLQLGRRQSVTDATCRSRKLKDDRTIPEGFQLESTGAVKLTGETATMPVKATYKGQTRQASLVPKRSPGSGA
jgi:hypothetical protein